MLFTSPIYAFAGHYSMLFGIGFTACASAWALSHRIPSTFRFLTMYWDRQALESLQLVLPHGSMLLSPCLSARLDILFDMQLASWWCGKSSGWVGSESDKLKLGVSMPLGYNRELPHCHNRLSSYWTASLMECNRGIVGHLSSIKWQLLLAPLCTVEKILSHNYCKISV